MAERGTTLLEVLVALAVTSIGVAACAQLLIGGLAGEAQSALQESAVLRLADAMELLQAWPAGVPAAPLADWHSEAAELRGDGGGAAADLQSASSGANLRLGDVSLRWSDTALRDLHFSVFAQPVPP